MSSGTGSSKGVQGSKGSGRSRVPPLGIDHAIILASVMQLLAILTTVIRLVHRRYIHRLWWDDFWAGLALICDLAFYTMFLVKQIETKRFQVVSMKITLVSRWTTLLAYTIALWTSRLTISVTLTRLLPNGRLRQLSKAASLLFGAFVSIMVLQKTFYCGTNWRKQAQCPIPRYTGYMELVMDNIADLWLILGPAYMLWNTKLQPSHRRLIAAIFMCGILTILASIAHSVFIIIISPQWVGLTAHIQVAIAMMVSNLLVLVTAIYRIMRRRARVESAPVPPIPQRPSGTIERRDADTDNDTDMCTASATDVTPNVQPSTQYSHLTLTELTDSRYANTRTHITLTELTEPCGQSTQQLETGTNVASGASAKEDASVEKASADSSGLVG